MEMCAQVPYVGNFLFRPAATNEVAALVPHLAQLSVAANKALGIYDDHRALGRRPPWQRTLVQRMHAKGWSIDLRRWLEFESLTWLLLVSLLWYIASRLLLDDAGAVFLSFVLLFLLSALTTAGILLR